MATLQAPTTKGTVTLKQSGECLPTQYLPEFGGVREGKAIVCCNNYYHLIQAWVTMG